MILASVAFASLFKLSTVFVSVKTFDTATIFESRCFLNKDKSSARGKYSILFCFLDPNEAKDLELILEVQSAS